VRAIRANGINKEYPSLKLLYENEDATEATYAGEKSCANRSLQKEPKGKRDVLTSGRRYAKKLSGQKSKRVNKRSQGGGLHQGTSPLNTPTPGHIGRGEEE